jgi:hypothetical protein
MPGEFVAVSCVSSALLDSVSMSGLSCVLRFFLGGEPGRSAMVADVDTGGLDGWSRTEVGDVKVKKVKLGRTARQKGQERPRNVEAKQNTACKQYRRV